MNQPELRSYRTFYESHAWEQLTEIESQRLNATVAHVPAGTEAILEIGCGDGRFSSMLPQARFVGVDYSFSALQNFRARNGLCAQGSAHALPFPSRSFDLVVCTEVLEHLPSEIFRGTLDEINRVARRYVLISVPFAENLGEQTARCQHCKLKSHRYGHVRNFDAAALRGLFGPHLSLFDTWTMGPSVGSWFAPLLWFRGPTSSQGTCLHCGRVFSATPTLRERVATRLHTELIAPWRKKPYWIGGVYRRMGV